MGSTKPAWDGCNKVLEDKWHGLTLESHHTRLARARATLHTQSPTVRMPVKPAYTTPEMLRQDEIERENNCLARKLAHLDKPVRHVAPQTRPGPSMTFVARKREQKRIAQENDKMLARLNNTKTSFSRAKWHAAEKERGRWLANISQNRFVVQYNDDAMMYCG
ncbi:Aste57867_2518 [Aphanomyces stellatus]|uniref:Aste57867_2518 protein n=1 Tax=Aphanomyces stellatus TaxID=120398 RepID=A0A485K971_9STRA|nr:hypothetical protein As57867_002511 [Aphanomyces stellatus]VFT79717.1 Aste57867_2518 [Aphanomyces stellatus]